LDKFDGAAAAYSLRKLRRNYSGDAIRVRRSSDNSEKEIGFDGDTVDTQALTDFANGSADLYVVTWYDQSGNNRDASQSTQADQPKIVNAGSVITKNGKPALDFDGSSQNMTAAKPSMNGKTELLVVSPESVSSVRILGNPNASAGPLRLKSGTLKARDYDSGTTFSTATKSISTEVHLITYQIADSDPTMQLWIDASKGSDGPTIGSDLQIIGTAETSQRLGSSRSDSKFFDGKMQERVLWPSKRADRADIESSINDHYGIY
jgi:hypothetical protein